MNGYIKKFNEVRREIEAGFIGLPHAHQLLIHLLLTRANSQTGVVENLTYSDLAVLLSVDSAPGRKNSGTLQKQTIRSYLRTIAAQCGDHFKIMSDGQDLKIQFPDLPVVHAFYFEDMEEYIDKNKIQNTTTSLTNIDENSMVELVLDTDQDTEVYTPALPVKNNILNKNKTNITGERNFSSKKPIEVTFYPSQETIELALQRGFAKVTDLAEISKFIAYNQEQGSRWPDFNPIFIKWLECEKAQASIQQKTPLRNDYERRTPKGNSFELLMQAVTDANPNARAPSECRSFDGTTHIINGEHSMVMASVDRYLWPALRQQTWNA